MEERPIPPEPPAALQLGYYAAPPRRPVAKDDADWFWWIAALVLGLLTLLAVVWA